MKSSGNKIKWLCSLLAMLCLGLCLSIFAVDAQTTEYGSTSRISVNDLFAATDLGVLTREYRELWLPPSEEYLRSHINEPEDPAMRHEFDIWIKSLLISQLLPADISTLAPYVKIGNGHESKRFSHFYAAYDIKAASILIRGTFARTSIFIKPAPAISSVEVATAFEEANALADARQGKPIDIPQIYTSSPRLLAAYLRTIAENYINPVCLPSSESLWEHTLNRIHFYNRGFLIFWQTQGYKNYLTTEQAQRFKEKSVMCSLWTNGKVVKIGIEPGDRIYSAPGMLASIPGRRPASATPLNPSAVELWDMASWFAEGGPVDDPARATSMMSCVVVKAPYAPNVGVRESGEETGGQPWWSNETLLPMTPLKWHIAEFAALTGGTALDLGKNECAYQDSFSGQISTATNRQKLLDEAKIRRDKCAAIAGRFASLAYPPEVRAERDELLAAIRANVNAWDAAITFWQSVVQEFPDSSEAFYKLRATGLCEQLTNADLANTAERIEKAVNNCAVPLYKKFDLEK